MRIQAHRALKPAPAQIFRGTINLWLERSIPDGLQRRLPPGRVVMVDLGSFAEDLSGLIMVRTGEKFFYFPAEKNEGQS